LNANEDDGIFMKEKQCVCARVHMGERERTSQDTIMNNYFSGSVPYGLI
jgi:hypothetical protein